MKLLLPYRNRPTHLRLFLQCFSKALQNALQPHTATIIELDTDEASKEITKPYEAFVTHHQISDSGPFQKARAYNYGVSLATDTHILLMDIDCLMPPSFLRDIEVNLHNVPTWQALECRVLDLHSTRMIRDGLRHFENVWKNSERHPYNFNVGGTGMNSQLIFARKKYMEVGGYNQIFEGYGYEDAELLHRCRKHLGQPIRIPDLCCFHLEHLREQPQWHEPEMENQNKLLFEAAKAAGFPIPVIDADWGRFA